jgi:hypothetical protein
MHDRDRAARCGQLLSSCVAKDTLMGINTLGPTVATSRDCRGQSSSISLGTLHG